MRCHFHPKAKAMTRTYRDLDRVVLLVLCPLCTKQTRELGIPKENIVRLKDVS